MHFENHMYYNPEDKARSVLYQHAIPTIFDVPNPPKRTEMSRRLPTKRRTDNNNVDYFEPPAPKMQLNEERKEEKHDCYWKKKCLELQRQNLILHGQNNRLKKKLEDIKTEEGRVLEEDANKDENIVEISRESLPVTVLQFIQTQIRFFSRKK